MSLSEKLVLFCWSEHSSQKFMFHFFKPIFDSCFRLSWSIQSNYDWFVEVVKSDSWAKFTNTEFWLPVCPLKKIKIGLKIGKKGYSDGKKLTKCSRAMVSMAIIVKFTQNREKLSLCWYPLGLQIIFLFLKCLN